MSKQEAVAIVRQCSNDPLIFRDRLVELFAALYDREPSPFDGSIKRIWGLCRRAAGVG